MFRKDPPRGKNDTELLQDLLHAAPQTMAKRNRQADARPVDYQYPPEAWPVEQYPPYPGHPHGGTVGRQSPSRARPARVEGDIGSILFSLMSGFSAWVIGAKFTIDGVVWIVNEMAVFLSAPYHLETSWGVYPYLVVVPITISFIEWRQPALRFSGGRVYFSSPATISIWLIAFSLDFISTFAGLGMPRDGATSVEIWFTATVWAKLLAAIFFTLWPEWIMKDSIRKVLLFFGRE